MKATNWNEERSLEGVWKARKEYAVRSCVTSASRGGGDGACVTVHLRRVDGMELKLTLDVIETADLTESLAASLGFATTKEGA